jgi:hypothetical protein
LDDRILTKEFALLLDKTSALPISLILIDGKTLATIGDAGAYLSDYRRNSWKSTIGRSPSSFWTAR